MSYDVRWCVFVCVHVQQVAPLQLCSSEVPYFHLFSGAIKHKLLYK